MKNMLSKKSGSPSQNKETEMDQTDTGAQEKSENVSVAKVTFQDTVEVAHSSKDDKIEKADFNIIDE